MAHYIQNTEKNGIEIYFDGKPSEDILTKLKENKWRWFPSKRCWYNRYSSNNELFAKIVCLTDSMEVSNNQEKAKSKTLSKQKVKTTQEKPVFSKSSQYKTSALRNSSIDIERDLSLEKSFGIKDLHFYYYTRPDGEINIIGELFCNKGLSQNLCFVCTLYDSDDDVIESAVNRSYGKTLVTNMIKKECYFDGYPFSFRFSNPKIEVTRVKIVPATRY